jgi:large subunit ribosomal protein L10
MPAGYVCRRSLARSDTRNEVSTLNRDQKAEVIAELEKRLGSTTTILAADFRGLTVKELYELRGNLRAADAEMTVAKNTLARRAAAATGREGLLPYLDGPSGLVWVDGDPAAAAKALADYAKTHDALSVKGGLLEGADISADGITRLAALPSREQLLSQLAGGLTAPLSGLAGSLHQLIAGLARALAAVQSTKDTAAEA